MRISGVDVALEIGAAHVEAVGDGLAISSDSGLSASLGLSTGSAFSSRGPFSTGSSRSRRHSAHPVFRQTQQNDQPKAHS